MTGRSIARAIARPTAREIAAFGGAGVVVTFNPNLQSGGDAPDLSAGGPSVLGADPLGTLDPNDALGYTTNLSASSNKYVKYDSVFNVGEAYSISFEWLIPTGNSYVDGFKLVGSGYVSSTYSSSNATADDDRWSIGGSFSLDTWNTAEAVMASAANADLVLRMYDGGSPSIGSGSAEEIYFRNIRFTQ